jgi:ATP-dependent DNA helicase RecG
MLENQNIEWKQSWHDDYIKWICGFANARGGTIYIGKDDADLRFQETLEGNLMQLLRTVPHELNQKFLTRQIDFEGLHRVEKGEYPAAALREMLINAMVHRSYMGSMIQLRVHDNKLSIWNEGTLPEGMDIASLKRHHPSRPRNLLIADICFKAGYIDSWGRGTLKIFNSCRDAGLPEPIISELNGGILVTLYKNIFTTDQLRKLGLNKRQINAVKFLKTNKSISNSGYQNLNNVRKTTATEELSYLVDLGILNPAMIKGRGAYYTLK